MFRRYSNPGSVGWLGWFECDGRVTAFVDLKGRVCLFDGNTQSIEWLGG